MPTACAVRFDQEGSWRRVVTKLFSFFTLFIGVLSNGRALGKIIDNGPQKLDPTSSIGEALRHTGNRPLHILYVHGIGATGAGGSQIFQKAICDYLKDCTSPPSGPVARDYADIGVFAKDADPPDYQYMENRAGRTRRNGAHPSLLLITTCCVAPMAGLSWWMKLTGGLWCIRSSAAP